MNNQGKLSKLNTNLLLISLAQLIIPTSTNLRNFKFTSIPERSLPAVHSGSSSRNIFSSLTPVSASIQVDRVKEFNSEKKPTEYKSSGDSSLNPHYFTTKNLLELIYKNLERKKETNDPEANFINQNSNESEQKKEKRILDPISSSLIKKRMLDPISSSLIKKRMLDPISSNLIKKRMLDPISSNLIKKRMLDPISSNLIKKRMLDPISSSLIKKRMLDPISSSLIKKRMLDPISSSLIKKRMLDPISSSLIKKRMLDPISSSLIKKRMLDPISSSLIKKRMLDPIASSLIKKRMLDPISSSLIKKRMLDPISSSLIKKRKLDPIDKSLFKRKTTSEDFLSNTKQWNEQASKFPRSTDDMKAGKQTPIVSKQMKTHPYLQSTPKHSLNSVIQKNSNLKLKSKESHHRIKRNIDLGYPAMKQLRYVGELIKEQEAIRRRQLDELYDGLYGRSLLYNDSD